MKKKTNQPSLFDLGEAEETPSVLGSGAPEPAVPPARSSAPAGSIAERPAPATPISEPPAPPTPLAERLANAASIPARPADAAPIPRNSVADSPGPETPPDQAARDFAISPSNDVVLEASAGTGKTRVLVDRYVRLIEEGVDPRHILALTFTRKAAAEMRERVLGELRRRAAQGVFGTERWKVLESRVTDIEISTIDAFCFGLLREFPLEANVDPAFEIADETEIARFANEAMELTLRAARGLLDRDEHVQLLFTRVRPSVLRSAIASLIDRRHVALPAIAGFVRRQTSVTTAEDVAAGFVARIADVMRHSSWHEAFFEGPSLAAEYRWLAADLRDLPAVAAAGPARAQQLRRRLERYFLTQKLEPRKRLGKAFSAGQFPRPAARKAHEQAVGALAGGIADAIAQLDADVNGLLARGLLRVFAVAARTYETLLEEHALLDFAGMLERAVELLDRQEEFARSRLKLQARYHHLLIDEFQDTSRRQWQLIDRLIDAWGEGEGTADAPTSIFVVGDRKQSIYRFRHAEVTLLDEAARRITALRPGRVVRQAITTSFRAVPELLAFVNALSHAMQRDVALDDRFDYSDRDRFPVNAVPPGARRDGSPVLGIVAEASMDACAAAVADEIVRLLESGVVRDRRLGARPARPDDVAILFRARAGHQYFEEALEARGVRTYVYKGLGFFDAAEVQDLQALIRFLAKPDSDLRAAEFLRSRIIRLSDVGLARLAPGFSAALLDPHCDLNRAELPITDRSLLDRVRADVPGWLALADRIPPSDLVDVILRDTAYAHELAGRRRDQARENVKKVRSVLRRVENRGYATLDRLATYFDTLRAGDESNAIVEAAGAVNLMTIHASKGLEFPYVFIVNLHVKGRGRPAGFSVIERGPDGEPHVAFSTSDATRQEDAREDEEMRRLLYVAVTRARDRLYLAAEVNEHGRLRAGGKSLAGLMPQGLAQAFGAAATTPVDDVEWTTDDGAFAFAVLRPGQFTPMRPAAAEAPVRVPVDVQPLRDTDRAIRAATDPARAEGTSPPAFAPATAAAQTSPTIADARARVDDIERQGDAPENLVTQILRRDEGIARDEASLGRDRSDDRLIGSLVHRLFQRSVDATLPLHGLLEAVRTHVDLAEIASSPNPDALVERIAEVYRQVRLRPDVAAVLEAGDCYYEVSFSYDPPDRPNERIRGSIDCLVMRADGGATVVEFKTGAPRPEHRLQAELYAEAMRDALRPAPVDFRLFYANA